MTKSILTDCVHEQNRSAWEAVGQLAERAGLEVRHNATSKANYAGYHRYVVLEQGTANYACNSKACLYYAEAPYSRYFKPSVSGELDAITEVYEFLSDYLEGV